MQPSQTSEAPSSSNYDKLSGETSHDEDFQFEGIGQDFTEEAVLETPAVPKVQPTVQTSPTAAQAPQAQPQVVPPVAQQPQQQPVTETQNQQPAAQPTEVSDRPQSLDDVLTSFESHPDLIAQNLAQNFVLDEQMAQELETNYSAAIPKLLAKTFTHSVHASLQYMKQFVPQIVEQYTAQQNAYRDAEQTFFSKFAQLDRSKHGEDIRTYARAFAAQNPNLTRDQLFNLVGTAVMAKHNLVHGSQPQARPAAPSGFVPAVGNAPVVSTQLVKDDNPFMALGLDFSET